jgi:hypothetical protein
MRICEAYALGGEAVYVWRVNLRIGIVAGNISKAEVVGHNENNIRMSGGPGSVPLCGFGASVKCDRRGAEPCGLKKVASCLELLNHISSFLLFESGDEPL